ncbi:MAG: hypothetical protein JWP66_961 [Naasia sp.]|nr:hypothetical protein [Naasia sp.]
MLAAVVTDPGWVHVIACGPRAFEETMRAHLADIGVPAGSVASDPFFIPSG